MGYLSCEHDPATHAVFKERERQDTKWGEQNHDPFAWLAILAEEVGETAKEALTLRFQSSKNLVVHAQANAETAAKMRAEAVQVAAVALAFVQCLDRNLWVWPWSRDPQPEQRTMPRDQYGQPHG